MGLSRAKVLHEAEQRGLRSGFVSGSHPGVAVVIACNREDGPRIILIRLVELRRIKLALPVEIHYVAEIVEERRLLGVRRGIDLTLHRLRNGNLAAVAVNAAGIARKMEDQFACRSRAIGVVRQYRTERERQIDVIGERRFLEVRILFRKGDRLEVRTAPLGKARSPRERVRDQWSHAYRPGCDGVCCREGLSSRTSSRAVSAPRARGRGNPKALPYRHNRCSCAASPRPEVISTRAARVQPEADRGVWLSGDA